MGYIGNKPANKAVVASDLDPAVITGQTALAVAPADTDEFLISDAGTLKRIDASLVGGGGITVADQWRITSDLTSNADPITNVEQVDTAGQGTLGSAMTQSSGIFTFPATGIYSVRFNAYGIHGSTNDNVGVAIHVSTDGGSSYNLVAESYDGNDSSNSLSMSCESLIDVTNVSNVKVKFQVDSISSSTLHGSSTVNKSAMTFIRLGDT